MKEKIGEEESCQLLRLYAEQAELLPRHVRASCRRHLCFLIHELIEAMDLSRLDEAYSEEGQKAYNPRLMLKLWLYGFAVMCARPASWSGGCRKIWDFVLAGRLRPDTRH